MKKIMALVLAIVMCLSCLGAAAESVTMSASIAVNEEAVLGLVNEMANFPNEEMKAMYQGIISNILAIVNNLGGRMIIADNAAQVELTLKDQPVVTLQGVQTEEGVAIVSDLIPSYAIVVPNEYMQQALSTVTPKDDQGASLDQEAIMAAVMGPVQTYVEAVKAKIGTPEPCQVNMKGGTFNLKVPVNMTSRELITMSLELVQSIAKNEAMAPLFAQMEGFDPAQIDQMLAQFSQIPDEQLPEMELNYYLNTEKQDNMFMTAQLLSEDQVVAMAGGVIDGVYYGDVWTGENIYNSIDDLEQAAVDGSGKASVISVTMIPQEKEVEFILEVTSNAQYVALDFTVGKIENGFSCSVQVYYMNDEAPLAQIDLLAVKGGEISAVPSLEGKTIVTIEELTGENSAEIVSGLKNDLSMYGLGNVLTSAAAIMPDEIIALMTMPQASMGGGTDTTAPIEGVNQ